MKKQTMKKKRYAKVESVDDFADRVSVIMKGKTFTGDGKLVKLSNKAKGIDPERPIVRPGKPTYGYNKWDKPKKDVTIINPRGHTPVWSYADDGEAMSVSPTADRRYLRFSVSDADNDTSVIWLPMKAFRALSHWGMPIARRAT
jgi:hypothetical protein